MGQGNNNGGRSTGVLATLGVLALAAIGSYLGIDGLGGSGTGGSSGGDAATATKQVAASSAASASGLDKCALDTLPDEAEDTADDILAGGPYDHPDNDNKRFGNYEGVLPKESKNYYREYTVDTPGLNHRGARRIVTGGGTETDPEVWYYTNDHYESFCEIPDAEG
ncbi:ribonuclease [Corynebacterium incognita]|uniref:Ribonuclease n=1 Tax=Corynebacterium incognita TaxID=2754725 RepID=A0A7G7CQV0_9CORY|nr:ribonuclease domain-containing protein [Corynebacterium incognita]QNE89966.1 ribonuclease [Corynebacterium incognita]